MEPIEFTPQISPPPPPRTSGMAIAGFVLAFFCGVLGLIFSAIALSQIGNSKGQLKGKGLAIAGLVISIVFGIVGMLAAVAIPAFMEYMHKGKTTEAKLQLTRLSKVAKSYYAEYGELPTADGPLTPAEPCCKQPGRFCPAGDPGWQDPAWLKLDFEPYDRTRFQYTFHSTPTRLIATAVGDLDCDGAEVSYTLTIDINGGMPSTSEVMQSGRD